MSPDERSEEEVQELLARIHAYVDGLDIEVLKSVGLYTPNQWKAEEVNDVQAEQAPDTTRDSQPGES